MSEYAKPYLPRLNELPEGIVTFLFTDIEGSTQLLNQLGDQYADLLGEHHEIIRKLINKWHGQEVGTQGDAFFIAFAQAEQAVHAVVEIQNALSQHNWPQDVEVRVRMGLHTGKALISKEGYFGIDVHRAARIAHIGHGGQVLLSERTEALVRDELPLGVSIFDLGTYRLKDLRKPDQIFQLIIDGLPAEFPPLSSLEMHLPKISLEKDEIKLPPFLEEEIEVAYAPKFVRRERELQQLSDYLQKAMDGEGQVVFVTGEAGRGKTALVEEFTHHAMEAHPKLLVVSGNCNSYSGIGDPYHPFREIFSQLVGDLETNILKGVRSRDHVLRLWRALPTVLSALMERGPDLFNVLFTPDILLSNVTTALPGNNVHIQQLKQLVRRQIEVSAEMQQTNLFGQCANVLELLASEYPLILVLDDLQWADAASIGLLFHLGQGLNGTRILIVGTFRSDEIAMTVGGKRHPLDTVINEFKRKYGDIIIELDRVTNIEGRRFIDAYLDTEPNNFGSEFRKALFKQTEGHALFTVELLKDMQERGDLLKDESGDWIIGSSIDWDTLPKRLDGAIAERIDRLDEPLRDILQVASVEGVDFTAQVVSGVLEFEFGKMVRLLSRELIQRHRLIIERDEQLVGHQQLFHYRFLHNLFQRYLYSLLSKGERRDLHDRIAHQLENLFQGNQDAIAVQLAHHYSLAGNREKTREFLQLAGDQALRQYAYREAIHNLSSSLELSQCADFAVLTEENQLQCAHLYSGLGRANIGLGKIAEARDFLSQAIAILDKPIPSKSGKLLMYIIRQFIAQLFHRIWPQRWIGRLQSDSRQEATFEAARLYPQLGLIYFLDNDTLPTVYIALRALNLAERVGPSSELAEAYATMCVATGLIPIHSLAEFYQRKATEIAEIVNTPLTTVLVSTLISVYYIGVGEWEKSQEILEKTMGISRQLGNYRRLGEGMLNLANSYLLSGKTSQSLELFDLLVEKTKQWNNPLHQVWGLEGQANHALRKGKPEDALILLEDALTLLKDNEDQITEIEILGLLGLSHLRIGNLQTARQAAGKAFDFLGQSSPTSYALFQGYTGIAEVYLKLWEESKVSKEFSAEEEIFEKMAYQSCKFLHGYARIFPIGKSLASYYRGKYEWVKNKPRVAYGFWRKSLKESIRKEMPFEQGLAHLEFGRHLPEDDPIRAKHLSQAEDLFKKIEATYYIELAQQK